MASKTQAKAQSAGHLLQCLTEQDQKIRPLGKMRSQTETTIPMF